MDDQLGKIAGIFYAYRRLMMDLGVDTRAFTVSPREFDAIYRLHALDVGPAAEVNKVEIRGEFYEEMHILGLEIRCHLPDEKRRQQIEMERRQSSAEVKARELAMMMHPFPTMLTDAEIEKLGLAGLEAKPGGVIGRKK